MACHKQASSFFYQKVKNILQMQEHKMKVALLVLVVLAGVGSGFYLKDDNLIEEAAEAVIKHETGLDIDLTPDSEEE